MAAPPTVSTGVYQVRTQATYQSRYQKHLNSSSTLPYDLTWLEEPIILDDIA
jgi:hypothetical protein